MSKGASDKLQERSAIRNYQLHIADHKL
jgi:hypothetical protein